MNYTKNPIFLEGKLVCSVEDIARCNIFYESPVASAIYLCNKCNSDIFLT
mgnify:CR=1 FL=1